MSSIPSVPSGFFSSPSLVNPFGGTSFGPSVPTTVPVYTPTNVMGSQLRMNSPTSSVPQTPLTFTPKQETPLMNSPTSVVVGTPDGRLVTETSIPIEVTQNLPPSVDPNGIFSQNNVYTIPGTLISNIAPSQPMSAELTLPVPLSATKEIVERRETPADNGVVKEIHRILSLPEGAEREAAFEQLINSFDFVSKRVMRCFAGSCSVKEVGVLSDRKSVV